MKKVAEEKRISIDVISRGIYASNDNLATEEAIQILYNLYGIDISEHRATRLVYNDIADSDKIYVMTENHKNLINTTLEDDKLSEKIMKFSKTDIEDPYMGSKKDYELCAREIYKGILQIMEKHWEEF